jgi:hypothetical protein
MTDALTQGINDHLVSENERLSRELDQLRAALKQPVSIQVQSQDAATLSRIKDYLPQLTNIATNLSHTASAVQALTPVLEKIAKALEAD